MVFLEKSIQKDEHVKPGLLRRKFAAQAGASMLSSAWNTLMPGTSVEKHICTDNEETIYMVSGEVEFELGSETKVLSPGDVAFIPVGISHAYKNSSKKTAEVITFRPSASATFSHDLSSSTPSTKDSGVFIPKSGTTEFEFFPKVMRRDLVDSKTGATSTNFSEVVFSPGGEIPLHIHPEHEEFMVCLEGSLTFMYKDQSISASGGDVILVEKNTVHGVKNESKKSARMLPIHPVLTPVRIFL